MRARRRTVALLALLAVVWTSLWPLVSAAHALAAHEAMPLCHQAGMAVAMDEPVQQPGPAGHHPQTQFHCPLCIMAFYAGFEPPPVPKPASFDCRVVVADAYCAGVPADISLHLPHSRAPPVLA
jgi:hypothetical protein